jgi:hypothetical protein
MDGGDKKRGQRKKWKQSDAKAQNVGGRQGDWRRSP